MSKKKDRAWFVCRQWADLVSEHYASDTEASRALKVDPKVLTKPWKSAPRRWTLGDGEVYEFYCTNNKELDELEKLRDLELRGK